MTTQNYLTQRQEYATTTRVKVLDLATNFAEFIKKDVLFKLAARFTNNDTGESKAFTSCQLCGSTVAEGMQQRHVDYHDSVITQLEALAKLVAELQR